MAVNRSILPDGSLGYRAGTEGKTYKRVQDARIQDAKLTAEKKNKKTDQSIKSVCPVCNKEKCTCAEVRSPKVTFKDFKKRAFMDPALSPALMPAHNPALNPALDPVLNPAINPALNQVMNPALNPAMNPALNPAMNGLDYERMRALQLAQEQRRIKHMKDLAGPGAATKYKRLRYANVLPLIATTLGGAGVGAAAGAGLSPDAGKGAGTGALVGGGIGLLTGLLAHGIGSVAGKFSDISREELKQRLQNLGIGDYLVPGRGAYLNAQLFKDFEENESNKPQQVVF